MQFEFPWALGPADGRYVVRDAAAAPATHVLVLTTLGAVERRRLGARRGRTVTPEPPPTPVATARATVVDAAPVSVAEAERWLADAGTTEAEQALAQVARAVRAHRLASGDPSVHEPALAQALVVRAGHGAGEQVAHGRWSAARELAPPRGGRRRRAAVLRPQERVAALLGGHARTLACEELTLRAREDLDGGRLDEAALQLRAALDAALVQLAPAASRSAELARRVAELAEGRPAVAALADAALTGPALADAALTGAATSAAEETLATTLQRLESALRARIASESNAQVER
ncbi:MAG: hypothetical protein JSS99_16560 [Actinobacteria bacterium]|nr:hypothetical protein [Actinomycetota bacterium]